MYLPGERTLVNLKNCFDKRPGLNDNNIEWMASECDRTGSARTGIIGWDEVHIQPDAALEVMGKGLRVTGLVNYDLFFKLNHN